MSWVLGSRRRVMLVVRGCLLLLDLGRAVYARLGYARPMESWQPVPTVSAALSWPPGADLPPDAPPGQQANPVTRGEDLVHAEMGGLCQTPSNRSGIYRGDDAYLAGGLRGAAYPQGVFVTRNRTSDPETGLGHWTTAQMAAAIRHGRTPTRRRHIWGMPWLFLHRRREDDALAIAS